MRVLLLHLSDIHIENDKNIIMTRINEIKGAVLSQYHDIQKCIVIITGDIAYSGTSEQYLIALEFISLLEENLKNEGIVFDIEVIPGNHDCDFNNSNETRNGILTLISKNQCKIDKSIIANNILVQKNFHEFYSALKNENIIDSIFYKKPYKIGDKEIVFYCFNTAWMSSKHEKYGDLVFPIEIVKDEIGEKQGVTIALLHHPYNWFTYESRKGMKTVLEEISDIIITGHEHDGDMFAIKSKEGDISRYIQGGVLHENKTSLVSSFNIIVIDLNNNKYKYNKFEYKDAIYKNEFESDWMQLSNLKSKDRVDRLNSEFEDFLNDAGADFIHKDKSKIYLDDIYVYPNIKSITVKNNAECQRNQEVYIRGEKVFNFTVSEKETLFFGPNTSGKTSLAKQLFKTYLKNKYIPLYINGSDVNSYNEVQIEKVIYKEYSKEYSSSTLELYKQTTKQKKVLLLDDFHKISLNLNGKNHIANLLKEYFDIIIIFVSDEFYMEIISNSKEYNKRLLGFSCYEISQFGHLLRNKLITKWYTIGNEYSIDEIDLERKVIRAEEKINIVFNKNLMPIYPMNILLVLPLCDTIDAVEDKDQKGSYGYIYEALITNNLSKVESKIPINTKYTYLSVIAYQKYSRDLEVIDMDTLKEFHCIYEERYDKKIEFEIILPELIRANILEHYGDSFNFKYKYLYYYFVAKYISSNIEDDKIKELITNISDKLYIEVNANIILFLCHLSNNSVIIQNLLNSSKEIFSEYEPCDLNNNIMFLNELYKDMPKFIIELGDPKKNRESYLEDKDKSELKIDENEMAKEEIASGDVMKESLENDEEIRKVNMLNKSLKTMQILGLVVKNFEGSLLSDVKYEITKECYLLGMRTMSLYINTLKDNLGDFIKVFSELFGKEVNNEEEAKKFIFILSEYFAFAVIKRVSSAIGLEELNETYKKIINNNGIVSFKLIDADIKMEKYSSFPVSIIIQLNKELINNHFANSLLKRLVTNYFYLYSCNHSTRQKICDHLGIQLNRAKALNLRNKYD